MSKNPLWTNLLHQRDSNSLWKNHTNPDITERQIDKFETPLEGTTPPEWDRPLPKYEKSGYTINSEWIIKSGSKPMIPHFYKNKLWPRIKIQINKKNKESGNIEKKEIEISVAKMMSIAFWPYIEWYSIAKNKKEEFMIIPKDGIRENLSVKNIKYISKKDYREIWSKRADIKTILTINPTLTDKQVEEKFWYSRPHISRVRKEMWENGTLKNKIDLEEIRQKIWIQITQEMLPIYQALIECEWKLSDSEIIQIVLPWEYDPNATNKDKKNLFSKVTHARRKLIDKWIITKYNENFKEKREDAIKMIEEKWKTGLTNKQIAETLGLNTEQINNLTKRLKKNKKKDENQ